MKIALIAPPFISVPPADYGGTELFVAHLAEGLQNSGVEVVVYANGESTVNVERRWMFAHSQWPIKSPEQAWIKQLNHESWALQDALRDCQVQHVQSAQAIAMSRFVSLPTVLTLHGPYNAALSQFYTSFPDVYYVSISDFQRSQESMPRTRTIHHGIDVTQYRFVAQKKRYISFIGRIAPIKGVHLAIDVARRTGIPLKIAGDIQPLYREYFEQKIKPHIDGSLIEYIGLANLDVKNDLLGNSMAMLFPIQWNEPFGLVMVEAMACGTPVLAMPGGSVPEVVHDGISGYICRSVREMTNRLTNLQLDPATIRRYAEQNFSIEHMVRDYIGLYEDAIRNHNSTRVA